MSRLVLLEIDDREVDVLSRLPGWGPRENIVVVHTSPDALIRGLAELAEIPVADLPPSPRVDDEVVVTENPGDRVQRWVEGWRDAGARIYSASEYRASGGGTAARSAPREERSAPGIVREMEERERRVSLVMNARGAESAAVDGGSSEHALAPSDAENPERRDEVPPPAAAVPPSSVPFEIWTDPEATFRFLLGEHAGRAVLWWDGTEDVWVPWIRFGGRVNGGTAPPEDSMEIPSTWGKFRLAGVERAGAGLVLPALARVADDIALRDLAAWRRTEDRLLEHRVPARGDALPVIRAWGERVLEALGAEASFVWRETGDSAWELAAARGEGVRFTGELRLAGRILASLFDVENGAWTTWAAGFGIRLDACAPTEDPRWALRWQRVRRAAIGERSPDA